LKWSHPSAFGFVTLAERLEQILGQRVDMSRRAIKPSLWRRIESELIDA
jgi:predicted nucleotidyltransferase